MIACQMVHPATYEIVSTLRSGEPGYRVYAADSDQLSIGSIQDGKNTHTIEEVECQCPLVASLRLKG